MPSPITIDRLWQDMGTLTTFGTGGEGEGVCRSGASGRRGLGAVGS